MLTRLDISATKWDSNEQFMKYLLSKQNTNLQKMWCNLLPPLNPHPVCFSQPQSLLCWSAESQLILHRWGKWWQKKGNTTSITWKWFGYLKGDKAKYAIGQWQPRKETQQIFSITWKATFPLNTPFFIYVTKQANSYYFVKSNETCLQS